MRYFAHLLHMFEDPLPPLAYRAAVGALVRPTLAWHRSSRATGLCAAGGILLLLVLINQLSISYLFSIAFLFWRLSGALWLSITGSLPLYGAWKERGTVGAQWAM